MKIQILATNNCMVSAIYGVLDVFTAGNYCLAKHYGRDRVTGFDCQIVTVDNKAVTGYNGIQIQPTGDFNTQDDIDVVIVSASVEVVVDCCGDDISIADKAKIKHWLEQKQQQQSLIASVCTGSFILASAGLLNGKTATTHWRSADLFHRVFPGVRLESEKLLVDNGDIICAGGSMAYIDLSLYLIEKYVGKDISSACAKLLVLDPVRQRQSPYISFKAQKNHQDQAILKAQEWLESHYSEDVSMELLAQQVGLGSRTFKRRFKLATGENPSVYLQRIRVELVKSKLEKTTMSVNDIVWSVGYEDISSFRQLFKRFTGLTPKDYRQKFA